ncbi:unnamed protein product [Trichobilharzia szidati]|nr:unnamed protein product [Trichobilharzia szidati]
MCEVAASNGFFRYLERHFLGFSASVSLLNSRFIKRIFLGTVATLWQGRLFFHVFVDKAWWISVPRSRASHNDFNSFSLVSSEQIFKILEQQRDKALGVKRLSSLCRFLRYTGL